MVSVNDCVEYYSPTGETGDDVVLRNGDVVKMYVASLCSLYVDGVKNIIRRILTLCYGAPLYFLVSWVHTSMVTLPPTATPS